MRVITKKTLYSKSGAIIISYYEHGEVVRRVWLDTKGKIVRYEE